MASVGTDAVKHYYIGVGVGSQRCCKTRQSLRELDNQGTVFLVWAVTMMAIEFLDHTAVRGGEPSLRTRGMIASRSVNMVRHPRGSYMVILVAASGVVTPENKVTHWRCHP